MTHRCSSAAPWCFASYMACSVMAPTAFAWTRISTAAIPWMVSATRCAGNILRVHDLLKSGSFIINDIVGSCFNHFQPKHMGTIVHCAPEQNGLKPDFFHDDCDGLLGVPHLQLVCERIPAMRRCAPQRAYARSDGSPAAPRTSSGKVRKVCRLPWICR